MESESSEREERVGQWKVLVREVKTWGAVRVAEERERDQERERGSRGGSVEGDERITEGLFSFFFQSPS